jgi:hypothetical protein
VSIKCFLFQHSNRNAFCRFASTVQSLQKGRFKSISPTRRESEIPFFPLSTRPLHAVCRVSLLFWGRACLAGKKLSFCAPAGTNESGKGNNMSKLREVDGKRNVISQQNRARRSRDACDAWCGGGTAPDSTLIHHIKLCDAAMPFIRRNCSSANSVTFWKRSSAAVKNVHRIMCCRH